MRRVILGSASPRRRELMEQAGIRFEVMTSNTPEVITGEKPEEIVQELAVAKGCAVAAGVTGAALIIGADTIVVRDGCILGKPKDEKDAVEILNSLQGRTHQVYTGVALIVKGEAGEEVRSFYEKTEVTMYPMTMEEILDYVATREPMDKAGAYGIQGRAAIFVREIKGDYNNVVGLPISRLYHELKEWINE